MCCDGDALTLLLSSDPGRDDGGWGAEVGETPRTMGLPPGLLGLHCHGYVLLPSSPCEPSRHGVQVPAEPPGASSGSLLLLLLDLLILNTEIF